ncbi:MAG: hypothetical protein PHS96_13550 [Anaerolineales bacterium]|nr:hypothetical protein [Anaerolineales bacterium]
MKRNLILILSIILLSACLPSASAPSGSPTPSNPQVIPTPSFARGDTFEVEAWVDNPEPAQGERVMLSGSLIKNGVYLGGFMMQATWPDETHQRGVPNCTVLVIYQRGVCPIDTSSLPRGVFVPITIKFEYSGATYGGQTGFTPQ